MTTIQRNPAFKSVAVFMSFIVCMWALPSPTGSAETIAVTMDESGTLIPVQEYSEDAEFMAGEPVKIPEEFLADTLVMEPVAAEPDVATPIATADPTPNPVPDPNAQAHFLPGSCEARLGSKRQSPPGTCRARS